MVCAHLWEAKPFLELTAAKEIESAPFPLYRGAVDEREVALTLCGTGHDRALMATTAWLSRELAWSSSGLSVPPLVVANFGTAGAYTGKQQVGQTLLISKLSRGAEANRSIYPERLVRWHGEEAECRTVSLRQEQVRANDLARGRKPVFDMEAFGVAQSALTFTSTAHLVVGKCVLDEIGDEGERALSIVELKERIESPYRQGAERFLTHALEHQALLAADPRRLRTLELAQQLAELSQLCREMIQLTVTQQRALEQRLRAALCVEGQRMDRLRQVLKERLGGLEGASKPEVKTALSQLLELPLES